MAGLSITLKPQRLKATRASLRVRRIERRGQQHSQMPSTSSQLNRTMLSEYRINSVKHPSPEPRWRITQSTSMNNRRPIRHHLVDQMKGLISPPFIALQASAGIQNIRHANKPIRPPDCIAGSR